MKLISFIFWGLLFPSFTFAKLLKGRIIDTSGRPIPSASVYIEEIKQGLICNAEGYFQVKLNPGTYRLECSCMGYNTEKKEVTIASEDSELEWVLSEKVFQLPEIEIHAGEDPAYAILRKAIEKAPYYLSVVKETTYEAYTKGSGKMLTFPKLMEKMSGEDIGYYKDKLFMQESVSEYKFTAPDQYEQTVKAYSSTIPNNADPKEALEIGMFSLYRPMYGDVLSPLNPDAFSYYRFKYEGYEEENRQIIYKIRIIPKLKDAKLLEGVFYIADEEWNIRHAEYTVHRPFMETNYRFNYHPVKEGVYLVTNFQTDIKANVLGVKMDFEFLSSIQYNDIQLNDSLVAVENSRKKPEKKKKKSLEIKRDDHFRKNVDSIAVYRDSVYWTEARTVALNEEELKSYARKDSVQIHTDSLSKAQSNPKFKWMDIAMGGSFRRDSSSVRIRYSGLLDALTKYDFVNGFWLGQSFSLDFKKSKNTGWIINPSVYWASARWALLLKTDISLDYLPHKLGHLNLSGGIITEDYSGDAGINPLVNTLFSLGEGRNYARFYEKAYVRAANQIDIRNGLQGGFELEFAIRRPQENHTTWNLFGREDKARPNYPTYANPLNEKYDNLEKWGFHFQYTPEYYYRMQNGRKIYVRSRFPTFGVRFQQGGIAGLLGSNSNYSIFSRLEFRVNQTVSLGLFDRFNYRLIAGFFLNDNPFNYIDYKHFSTGGNIGLNFSDKDTSYALLPLYTYSTGKNWLQAFVTYKTDYLAFKRLPFLQGKLFSESLHFKFLHTPEKPYYSEWGYSVDMPVNTASLGVFFSFDTFRYNSFGLQLSMPLFEKASGGREVSIRF